MASRPAGRVDLIAGDPNPLETFLLNQAFATMPAQDPLLRRASPVTYIRPNMPPVLIMHGEQDTVVPVSQGRALHARLQAAGAPSRLVVAYTVEPLANTPMTVLLPRPSVVVLLVKLAPPSVEIERLPRVPA